ncbi:MAG TPA: Uma2 family endonuclease [Candidatus Bathyarchaeia archaeon]|nr:Uma2 family endonuclease [Candidatus Bathyarchaeia archaeon]
MTDVSESATVRLPQGEISLEEWAALPEDEPGELVDGRLEDEEVPDAIHELVVGWLMQVLRNWLSGMGGVVLGSEAKFALRARRGRKPDLSLFLPGGAKPPRRGVIRVPPDIAIEISSPAPRDVRRDRIEKMDDYAGFGVRWYWIVDPELRSVEIYELGQDGRYMRTLGAVGRVEFVPGCAGLTLDLPALWQEIDQLAPEDTSVE